MAGGRLLGKWQRIANGKQLKTLVFNDFSLFQGQLLSPTVEELHFHLMNASGDHGQLRINWWEEYKPASPSPVIKSVVVKYAAGFQQDAQDFQKVVCLHRGDSFFNAFPKAEKLSFCPEPHDGFFDQPPNVFSNVREMTFGHPFPRLDVASSVFPFLGRFRNLEVLTLRDDKRGGYLERLPQDYVNDSVRTLNLVNVGKVFRNDRAWGAIPRQFPALRALRAKTYCLRNVLDSVPPSFLTDVFPKQLSHLESLELTNYDVPLDGLVEMVLYMLRKVPVTVKSVVCQSVCREAVLVPTQKLQQLREEPGCQLEFRLEDGAGSRNGFYFDFSRI